MEHLECELNALMSHLPNEDEFKIRLESLQSAYPFNEYEYIISTLVGFDVLGLDEYYDMRNRYIEKKLLLAYI